MTRTQIAIVAASAATALLGLGVRPASADGSVTFGSQWWDQNRPEAKYQEFSDPPRGGMLESFAWREIEGRNFFTLLGDHALRQDQNTIFTWANGARWRLDLRYQQTPHRISFVTHTPYTEVTPGVFALPDSLQSKNQTDADSLKYVATMTDLLRNAPRMDMGFRTDVTRARLRARPARGWQFDLQGTRRQRSGHKPYGGAFGFYSAIEIPEPISQRMWDADARASYYRDRLSLELGAGFSTFTNRVNTLVWDNPKRITDRTYSLAYVYGDGTSLGQLDLYPDNGSIRGSAALGYQLPRRTVFSANLMFSRDTQDDAWLPYTVNTAIAQADTATLPGTNTAAKATVLTQDYRLTSRPLASLTGTLRFRQSHYDNQTPEHTFPGYSRLDETWVNESVTNDPFGHQQRAYGVDLSWVPASRATLAGTFEVLQREHTHREVEEDQEKVFSAEARLRPARDVQAKVRYRRGDRKLDRFLEEEYDGAEQPELRRFDVADRVQDKLDVGTSWSPSERVVLSGSYSYLKNDFAESALGLQEEKQQRASFDATVRAAEQLDLLGGFGWGQTRTAQRSVDSPGSTLLDPATAAWTADLKDWSVFGFGSAEWQARPEKLSLSGGFEYERAPATFDFADVAGTAQDLDRVRYRRRDLFLQGNYRLDPVTALGLRWDVEKFDVQDWASTEIPLLSPATGSANAIYLGDSYLNYTAYRVALKVSRAF